MKQKIDPQIFELIKMTLGHVLRWFFKKKKEAPIEDAQDLLNYSSVGISYSRPLAYSKPAPQTLAIDENPKFWFIDPGHGPKQSGKRSPVLEDGRQLLEYELNRDIARRVTEKLVDLGIAFSYTVDPTDETVGSSLEDRVEYANNFATDIPKIFLSIHSNAGPAGQDQWSQAGGIETWHSKGSELGESIAWHLHESITKALPEYRNRGLKYSKDRNKEFYVLRETECPAVLLENLFYNNKTEVQALLSEDVRHRIASAIVFAIREVEGISNELFKPEKENKQLI